MDAEDLKTLNETDPDMVHHIYPTNDIREHITQKFQNHQPCWCDPELKIQGMSILLIHNSADGREAFETGERKPS